jgi:hypothetical protein
MERPPATRRVAAARPSAPAVLALAVASVLGAAPAAAGSLVTPGPVVGPSEILGPLVGPGAVPTPANLKLYGTDLGWTFEHQGELQILFGDTWIVSNSVCLGQPANDDSAGTLPLATPGLGAPSVTFHTKAGAADEFDPIRVLRGSDSLRMGYGQVPLTGFSDGVDAAAIFGRGEVIPCVRKKPGAKPSCKTPRAKKGEPAIGPRSGGLVCAELGACAPASLDAPVACDLGTGAGCGFGQTCEPTDTGFCIDPTSSQLVTPADAPFAVAHTQEIGIQRPSDPVVFDSVVRWRTNKFINATSRTVAHFSYKGVGDDYGPGSDALLVWGRPFFTGEQGRQAQLYLAVLDLPLRNAKGKVRFRPRYFAGLKKNGRPRWSHSEAKAAPLALDGVPGGSPHEEQPLVLQMGIGFVGAPLGKWVMLYSGDLPSYLLADPAHASPGPSPGAVRIRFADRPWGPWSPPQPILAPGDPATVGDPYGPGGVLYHVDCMDQGPDLCTPSDPTRPPHILNPGCTPFAIEFDIGNFYGSNLIDAYTGPDGSGGVDLYWNISTWNPYGVLLVKTHVTP